MYAASDHCSWTVYLIYSIAVEVVCGKSTQINRSFLLTELLWKGDNQGLVCIK